MSENRQESSDDYSLVIHQDGGRRVILCKHGLQWIIQGRRNREKWPWKAASFCATKVALLRLWGGPVPEALQSLPDFAQMAQSAGGGSAVSDIPASPYFVDPKAAPTDSFAEAA